MGEREGGKKERVERRRKERKTDRDEEEEENDPNLRDREVEKRGFLEDED